MKANNANLQIDNHLYGKFLVIIIAGTKYVIPLKYVNEIIVVPEVTIAPQAEEWIRGIITLRDKVITLIDTRKRLGMLSRHEEFVELMNTRERDHILTINTLEESIRMKKDFLLPTDPNACAFGIWINGELADKNLNVAIRDKIEEISKPHRMIHIIGAAALELAKNEKRDEALKKVEYIQKVEMPRVSQLFTELKNEYTKKENREWAVILEYNKSNIAILADNIDKISNFEPASLQQGSLTDSKMVLGVYHNTQEEIFQEINIPYLLKGIEPNT